MGLFNKIGDKNIHSNGGGVFFEPGSYELECRVNKSDKTREGRPYFVAEFTILASTNPSRPVGTGVSWMVMLDKYLETALGNIKGYVAALFGMPEAEVDEAGVEALISAENPGMGLKCKATASMTKTRGQKDFTKVVFNPMKTAE